MSAGSVRVIEVPDPKVRLAEIGLNEREVILVSGKRVDGSLWLVVGEPPEDVIDWSFIELDAP